MNGYFNNALLTDEVICIKGSVKYYKSGDTCKKLDDNTILYIGRKDDEIKINGKRIHLGEIRQKALSMKGIDRVAIGLIDRNNKKEILITIISKNQDIIYSLSKYLKDELPSYMRPTVWSFTENIQLSGTGKTNEKLILAQFSDAAKNSKHNLFILNENGEITSNTRNHYA